MAAFRLPRRVSRAIVVFLATTIIVALYIRTANRGDGDVFKPDYELPDFDKVIEQLDNSNPLSLQAVDEIRTLLTRSPVVIFSKTYCPHSRFIKSLLRDSYSISPSPLVRELDLDASGPYIQAALKVISGRRTVPNVFVGGKSLGGGDEMRLLHAQDQLAQEFAKNAGRRFDISRKNVDS
ncbi:thioredoxin-like protein [Limtongia smithiae]|uniref:thioredoxin-like protein n=1 Tax=Limtongia smithiae TaxID=1125753 RepID=UPI0034CDD252